ncbi:helix-turn-helix domain-containing protein [Cnuibacter physcomitrellae]|uniref:IclR family transcriptional regulator n=1 Tax=Cnuibacter physcomitrellae TaxID=1619308 RepID=UPI002175A2D4|nr:helix-turn-helix domain-containing protein [Cnuibacter physcomitrellae]MCS5498322.1 helix-turn-helix domain-containing protein [Cnuibacter physcomitrellae]
MSETSSEGPAQGHRTIDRVTEILETVVYRPGITFAELAREIAAPKSSVHGFVRGLLARGWLYQRDRRFYLGPAVYGLTLVSGQIRAGQVAQADLDSLHDETGLTVFLGVEAGDHLIYIGESGTDAFAGFGARNNIHRSMIGTAGGKALLAERPDAERDTYLRRQTSDSPELVAAFLSEFPEIVKTRVATNLAYGGTQLALATTLHDRAGKPVAAAVLIGSADEMRKRETKLRKALLGHVASWAGRSVNPREAV